MYLHIARTTSLILKKGLNHKRGYLVRRFIPNSFNMLPTKTNAETFEDLSPATAAAPEV